MRLRRSSLALFVALLTAVAASAVAAGPAAAQRVRPWGSVSLGVVAAGGCAESPCFPAAPLAGVIDAGLAVYPVPRRRGGDPWVGVGVQSTRLELLLSSNPTPRARLLTVRAGLGRVRPLSVHAGAGPFRYGTTRGRLREVGVRLTGGGRFGYVAVGRVRATDEPRNPGERPRAFAPRLTSAGLGVGF